MATVATSLAAEALLFTQLEYSAIIPATSLDPMTVAVPSLVVESEGGSLLAADPMPPPTYAEYLSHEINTPGENWFDIVHILPRRIDAGNILTVQVYELEIYNAFLYESHELQTFINNAGVGVSITDLPALPYTIPAQKSLIMTLEVTPNGIPTLSTTLDFDTDLPYLLVMPLTGTRIVMFPFEPEAPLTERLLFLTDVLEMVDGTEQRVGLRRAPRQEFVLRLMREDGIERQKVDYLLFDWSSRVFGLPAWAEPAYTTLAATASGTVVQVNDTTLSDFREDGLAIIFESEDKFDALEVETVGPTSITFKTPYGNNYGVGTRVMPLRTAMTSVPVKERRWAVNLAELELVMRVLDNDVDLSDTSDWPVYNGKVLLDDPNAIEETLDGDISRSVTVFDGSTGKFSQTSTNDRARRGSAKTFITNTREGLWQVRKLLHALRGKQVSFYLPTFSKDLILAGNYTSGNTDILVSNVGYSRFAAQRTPKVDVHIILKDGTDFERTITASAEVNEDTEQLTLSSPIGQNIAVSDIYRIEFYEKVRIDNDEITIEHRSANGEATIGFPVKVVLE